MNTKNLSLSSNVLLVYIMITFVIIIWSFLKPILLKKGTQNSLDKMIRLVNFFWLIPIKMYVILNVLLALIKLLKEIFGLVFVKIKNKEFSSDLLFFLNFGSVICLIIYVLKPKLLPLIILFYIVFGIAFATSLATLFQNSLKTNESVFPFVFSKKVEEIRKIFDTLNEEISFLEHIWLIFVSIFYIGIFLFLFGSVVFSIIPLSYFIAFIYTFKIPTVGEVKSIG